MLFKFIFLLYGLFLAGFLIFTYAYVDFNLQYLHSFYSGFANSHRLVSSIMFIFFILGYFSFYFLFIYLAKNGRFSIGKVKALVLLTVIMLFAAYPAMLSYDIFNYIATAKVLFFYHENPYVIMPIEFTGDPLLLFMHAANKVALYGPVWTILTGIPHFLGLQNFIITVLSFKFFVIFFYLGTLVLLWRMSKNIFSVIFFGLNPLVVIEIIISAHNDIVMMFLALISFFLLKKNNFYLSILFLISSILIKYATFFLIPVYCYVLFKRIKNEKVNWDKVFLWACVAMFIVFILSVIREEIYPWYAIWFLVFVSVVKKGKLIRLIALSFSISLPFRYVPFMYLGTHFGIVPLLKTLVTFLPPFVVLGFNKIKRVYG